MQNYTQKYRIYPTKEQEEFFAKSFGCCRFIYNKFLSESKDKNYKSRIQNQIRIKELKQTFPWLKEVNSQSLQWICRNLDLAFKSFFKKIHKYPKFKKRKNKQSFHCPQFVKIEDGKLFIPKLKQGIKIKLHRPIRGNICNCTITKTSSGKYYVSIGVEWNTPKLEPNNKMVGLDLGSKTLVVLSDGTEYPNIKPYRSLEKRLRIRNKALSRSEKGSKSREQKRIKLAKLHEKIANIRSNHLHQMTTQIIRENQTIVCEDLNAEGMKKNRKLAKTISDVSFGEIVRQLTYKAKLYGRTLIQVDRFFPSSKLCSCCGIKNEELKLEDREWKCKNCGSFHDRDFNASINILNEGKRIVGTTRLADCPDVSHNSIMQLVGSETPLSLVAG